MKETISAKARELYEHIIAMNGAKIVTIAASEGVQVFDVRGSQIGYHRRHRRAFAKLIDSAVKKGGMRNA